MPDVMKDGVNISKLRRAMEASDKALKPFRKQRNEMLREYAGHYYGEHAAKNKVPVNLLWLAVQITSRQLFSRTPQVLVTSPHDQLQSVCQNLGMALNHLLSSEIDLGNTIEGAVIDAMFMQGVVKVGMNYSSSVEVGGFTHDVGQPFADVIDLDNWIQDASVNRFDECQFMGDRYRIPKDEAEDCGLFDTSILKKVKTGIPENYTNTTDRKAEDMTRKRTANDDDFVEYYYLWDLWLPKHGKMLTMSVDGNLPPLRIVDWEGPERGPYHILSLSKMPNNFMPLAPALQLIDLHEMGNELYRKVGKQASSFKKMLGVQGQSAEDAQRVISSDDGYVVKIDNPSGLQPVQVGGADQGTLAMFLQNKQLFSWMAGNLESMGGLSAQAETLGQEELLKSSSNQQIDKMQENVEKFVRGITESLAWYLWYDPLISIPLTKRVRNTDIEIKTEWNAEMVEGDFLEYNISLAPYSMQFQTPGKKLQTFMQILQQFVLPAMPLLQQQGASVNMEMVLNTISRLANTPELERVISYSSPQQVEQPQMVSDGGMKKPAFSERRYIRQGRPGMTPQNADSQMAMSLMANSGKE